MLERVLELVCLDVIAVQRDPMAGMTCPHDGEFAFHYDCDLRGFGQKNQNWSKSCLDTGLIARPRAILAKSRRTKPQS